MGNPFILGKRSKGEGTKLGLRSQRDIARFKLAAIMADFEIGGAGRLFRMRIAALEARPATC
jgi:hypothetical protein